MSQLSRTPLLRSTLRAPAHIARGKIPRAATCQTRWTSSADKGKGIKRQEASFKGQMLESITERIARERAELTRAALEREATSAGRNTAATIGQEKSPLSPRSILRVC